MKKLEYLQFLQTMKARSALLQPATAQAVGRNLDLMIKNATVAGEEGEKLAKEYFELIQRAAVDATAKAELSQVRVFKVDNFIRARSNVSQFFEAVTLAPNEVPYIQNTTRTEIQVSFIGQDGRAKRARATKYNEIVQLQMKVLSTAEYEYELIDLYRGAVDQDAKNLVDLAWDLDRQVDALAWPYLRQQIGAFNLTGNRALKTFQVHSAVKIANLPATNLLVTPGNTTTSKFRKESLDVILKYCAAFGDALPSGPLTPVAIYIPSSDIMGFLDSVAMTTADNVLNEQVFMHGYPLSYGGRTWTLIPDVTLDPADNLAYVRFGAPIGMMFTKPNFDKVIDVRDETNNLGRMSQRKAVGWGLPSTYKTNIAAVQYRSAS